MERDERYEVNSEGKVVVGTPVTLSANERKTLIEKMFSINGWKYTVLSEITPAHFHIKLENPNLEISKTFHLYHGNVRKEDPERNREEKKIQLGTENDPRDNMDDAIILGFYVYEHKELLSDTVVVAWPIEENKNYPANPSLRVNMRTDIQVAKNTGYYVDKVTGKNLVVFRPEFIYHYIENYKSLQYSQTHATHPGELDGNGSVSSSAVAEGSNVLLYGVPGAGKSWTIEHEYCDNEDCMERLVFHPDYMYSDFVGQILPVVKDDDKVRYEFTPGPFTKLLKRAYCNPDESFFLIIEEINRGNAPAIFGEIFQLLDRKDEDELDDNGNVLYKKGTSEYGITNANIARIVYDDEEHKVRIPANMSILGTMNTSDQNVFTLDTAFQRRWIMRMIPNSFANHRFADKPILDTDVSWKQFCEAINEEILRRNNITSSEDKRLGAYFISASDLEMKPITDGMSEKEKIQVEHSNSRFAEKVLKYLWDDAFKFSHQDTFNTRQFGSLEKVIEGFMSPAKPKNERFRVFNENLRKMILDGVKTESNEVSDDDSEGSQES